MKFKPLIVIAFVLMMVGCISTMLLSCADSVSQHNDEHYLESSLITEGDQTSELISNVEDIVLDREPIYFDTKILEDVQATGQATSYEILADWYLSEDEDLSFVAYEIVSVYDKQEAYELIGKDHFLSVTALYVVHVYYDYIVDCEVDYYINLSKAGTAEYQYEGNPAYAVGEKYIAAISGDELRKTPYISLSFAVYEISGTEYAYRTGDERISLMSDNSDIDIPMTLSEHNVITSTSNNPVKYVQKSTLQSVVDFIRSDWLSRGIGHSFLGE